MKNTRYTVVSNWAKDRTGILQLCIHKRMMLHCAFGWKSRTFSPSSPALLSLDIWSLEDDREEDSGGCDRESGGDKEERQSSSL